MRFVIYNPASAGGRTGRQWRDIARRLETAIGPFEFQATTAPGDAAPIVRNAVARGAREVIAVGGDGTVNEVAHGLLSAGVASSQRPVLGFVGSGTGGDLCRSLGLEPGLDAACARLASDRTRKLDAVRVQFSDDTGTQSLRHYINIGSLGMSGATVRAVNSAGLSRLLGARGLFHFHSVATLLRYRFQRVGLRIDGTEIDPGPIATVVVANGSCFGGGMRIAPDADPCDGTLDIVVVRGTSRRDLIASMNLVYSGRHMAHPAVRAYRGRKIEAVPMEDQHTGPVLIELDGEAPGRLPATFELLPAALTLRC